ncbi:hypothetical protein CC77DRAFT_1022417 [Alternaria alternata]|uniref:Uncharacterized protein n=1 Tax=Alternaria alternata TaxID=5599 RepID=A0A177DH85_ALTAL|nr:hypothetical protein CC77DRAFT_1022417 [Alternaria alternata]OAG18189.1 hypothetical protein CC77DRAFT_1022417 [Alternaria alternata]
MKLFIIAAIISSIASAQGSSGLCYGDDSPAGVCVPNDQRPDQPCSGTSPCRGNTNDCTIDAASDGLASCT